MKEIHQASSILWYFANRNHPSCTSNDEIQSLQFILYIIFDQEYIFVAIFSMDILMKPQSSCARQYTFCDMYSLRSFMEGMSLTTKLHRVRL